MKARDRRLFHKLLLTAHQLQKVADREIAEATNLTTAQAAILSVLADENGTNQRAIALALGQNESAITAMIARLERLGYIAKRRNREDRRAWQLSLTGSGRAALKATQRPFSKVNKLIESELSAAEVDAFVDLLERLQGRLS